MANWTVYYEIGSTCDSQQFDNEADAECYFDMISIQAATFEEEGGDPTTVEMTEDEEDE